MFTSYDIDTLREIGPRFKQQTPRGHHLCRCGVKISRNKYVCLTCNIKVIETVEKLKEHYDSKPIPPHICTQATEDNKT